MDYIGVIRGLFKEAKRDEKFQDMSSVARIIIKVGLFPLAVLAFLAKAYYYVNFFIYKGFFLPLEHLHAVVKKEGQEVKHGTQVIIYWIAFPLIFFMYIMQALFAVGFYFQWFVVMTLVYLKSLGGVRWQPFLNEVSYEEEHVYINKHGKASVGVFATLLVISYLGIIVGFIVTNYGLFVFSIWLTLITLFILNPLLFRKEEIAKNV